MAELVVLQEKREKLSEGQDRVVTQLEDLLKKARSGKIRSMVYATIGESDGNVTLGVLNTDNCCLHELIGISQILNDRLLTIARQAQE